MKIVCAWCQKDMGEKPPYEDTSVTHTICDECRKKYFPEKEGSMDRGEVESLAKDALEHNPLSAHCERVLEKPPSCVDFRGARSFALCFSWKLMEEEKIGLSPALKRAWAEFRKVCPRE